MKSMYAFIGAVALTLGGAGIALAAPFNAASNPNTVANYPTGTHGIVGEYNLHEGADVVMKAGNSGVFQQWFLGTSTDGGTATFEGDHSVWKVSKNGSCDAGWILVVDASSSWGSYLTPGASYCVKTNDSLK